MESVKSFDLPAPENCGTSQVVEHNGILHWIADDQKIIAYNPLKNRE